MDEILENSMFQGVPINDYLESHRLKDKEILKLTKPELIKLLTKAIFVILRLQEIKIEILRRAEVDINKFADKALSQIDTTHSQIDTIHSQIGELLEFNQTITQHYLKLNKSLPKIKEKAVREAATKQGQKGAIAKLANDPKQASLRLIEREFHNSAYPFNKHGYRAKFCKEMLEKYTEIKDIKTIERLFDRLKKAKNTPSAS